MMVCQHSWVCIQLCTGGVFNKLCWGGLPIVLPNPIQHQIIPAIRQAATQTRNVWQDQRPPHPQDHKGSDYTSVAHPEAKQLGTVFKEWHITLILLGVSQNVSTGNQSSFAGKNL